MDPMELQQMRYVVAIAEERSFTRAAERCHVVQSSLSHQIAALERELGVRLFARTSRRVEPTDAGLRFVASARACLAAAERAAADAVAPNGELRGSLTLGVIPTVAAVDVPRALRAFHDAHPAVSIRVRSGGSDAFMAAIEAGTMDVALLGLACGVEPRGVASRPLAEDRHVAVLPVGHHLAGRSRLRLADLSGVAFVDFPAGSPGRTQTDLAFGAAGADRDVHFEGGHLDLMLGLIREGLAIGLLPAGTVREEPGLVVVDVEDGPARGEHLAWSAFNPSPAALALVETIGRGLAR